MTTIHQDGQIGHLTSDILLVEKENTTIQSHPENPNPVQAAHPVTNLDKIIEDFDPDELAEKVAYFDNSKAGAEIIAAAWKVHVAQQLGTLARQTELKQEWEAKFAGLTQGLRDHIMEMRRHADRIRNCYGDIKASMTHAFIVQERLKDLRLQLLDSLQRDPLPPYKEPARKKAKKNATSE